MGTVDEVTVIGAGAMGHGFAVQFVRSGIDATVVDHREANLDRARVRIRNAARFLVERELADPDLEADVATINYTLDRAEAVAETDLVLETIAEDRRETGAVRRARISQAGYYLLTCSVKSR